MDAIVGLGVNREEVLTRDAKRQLRSRIYRAALGTLSTIVLGLILAIILTIVVKGSERFGWEFISTPPKDYMGDGGIWPMLKGSLLLMFGTLLVVLPIGVLGGIFLAEYAGQKRWVDLARSLITSLAGTPSIVFGLFGLAIFVLMFQLKPSLMAGWLTLGVMSIPVVVLNTEQAIRSVPSAQLDAAISLGLTKWQTMAKVVLPQAVPGIMTGIVLASGRAAGEAPPILLTAAVFYSTTETPFGWDLLRQPVMNLPYHIAEGYRQPKAIPESIVWGTCLTLLIMVLSINLIAILVRSRSRRRRAGF